MCQEAGRCGRGLGVNIYTAAWAPVTVAKERHSQERSQEEVQVHTGREPFAKKFVGSSLALAQEEEGVEKH